MSLETRLSALVAAVGADIKSVNTSLSSKSSVFAQTSAPSSPVVGTIWIDTDDPAPVYQGPPLVTSLPGSPVADQEIFFQNAAMITAGVGPWRFRYRAASSPPWEFIGGMPWRHGVSADQAITAATVWTDMGGPLITPPLAGAYLVQAGCDVWPNGVVQSASVGLTVGAVNPTAGNSRTSYLSPVSVRQAMNVEAELTVTLGQDIRMRGWGSGGAGQFLTFGNRFMILTPLRVG